MSLYSNFGAIERNFHAHSHKIDYFIGNGEGRYAQMTVFEVWEIHTEWYMSLFIMKPLV